jgi:hypothetical protein
MFLIRGIVKLIILGLVIVICVMWLSEQGSPNPRTTPQVYVEDVATVTTRFTFQNESGELTTPTVAYFTRGGSIYELPQCVNVTTCSHTAPKNVTDTFRIIINGCETIATINNLLITDEFFNITMRPTCN